MNHQSRIKEYGFTVIKGVFSKEEMIKTGEFLNNLIREANDGYDPEKDPLAQWYLPHRLDQGVMYDMYQRHPEIRKYAEEKNILDTLAQYFMSDFFLYVNSFLFKPPGKRNEVPWHQDFLSRPNESEKILAWVAVDKADKSNGCLRVIPQSHKNGLRSWYSVAGETHHDRIKLSKQEEQEFIDIELEPGDILLFSQYLIHSSPLNTSSAYRKALRFVYKSANDISIPRGAPLMIRAQNKLPDRVNQKAKRFDKRLAEAFSKKLQQYSNK